MIGRSTVGFFAGLALAAGGLVAYLSSAATGADAPQPSGRVAASQEPRAAVAAGAPGLSESVTRVLEAEGFLGRDQGITLPLSVRRVLAEYDAVLAVEDLR